MDHIKIQWYGPYSMDNLDACKWANEYCGLYAIYRQFGVSPEKLQYIGQTTRPFIYRLREHKRDWADALRGVKIVRFGLFDFEEGQRFTQTKLDHVESLLIQVHQPHRNKKDTDYYRGRRYLTVKTVDDVACFNIPFPQSI